MMTTISLVNIHHLRKYKIKEKEKNFFRLLDLTVRSRNLTLSAQVPNQKIIELV